MTVKQLTKQLHKTEQMLRDIRIKLRKAKIKRRQNILNETCGSISPERAKEMLRYIEQQRRLPNRGPH